MEATLNLMAEVRKDPIVFELPGVKPDVSLEALGQIFHVHSLMLKLNSAFFRKFLDSAEKEGRPGTGTEMKYSWVTQLDDDGKSWSLVSSTSPKLSTNVESRLDDGMERFVFYNFLHVLYARPCDAGYHYQFLALFTMADYYAALPALSRILGSALLCSPGLVMTINDEALELFPLAAKLRNPMLFRECLVWLCSNWEAPEYRDLKETHPELYKLADRAYDGICRIVAHCGDVVRKWEGKLDNDCQSYVQELRREIFSYPEYLKRIYLLEYFEGDLDSMAQLKVIRLRLHYYVSYNFERLFLFADIKDEDLPWDPTEIEW